MASNHTANYGLSQWEGTDYFSRLDFNDDNLKIDSALKAIADTPDTYHLIGKKVSTYDSVSLTLNLGDIDLSEYVGFTLVVDIEMAGTYSDGGDSYLLRFNNSTSEEYRPVDGSAPWGYAVKIELSNTYPNKRILHFYPYEEGRAVVYSYVSFYGSDKGENTLASTAVKWGSLTSFNMASLKAATSIKTGSGLYLYGVKKS